MMCVRELRCVGVKQSHTNKQASGHVWQQVVKCFVTAPAAHVCLCGETRGANYQLEDLQPSSSFTGNSQTCSKALQRCSRSRPQCPGTLDVLQVKPTVLTFDLGFHSQF